MELPDCPPGAEGYQDTVVEMPNKFEDHDQDRKENDDGTKAEKEFQDHLNSLKIKIEDGSARPMVERQGRDVSGKWIYLCYPCAAMCSGESVLQTHISGKKHKSKLSLRNIWPVSIFEQHPYFQASRQGEGKKLETTEKILQKMAEEVDRYKLCTSEFSELDSTYKKYRDLRCHIQDTLDKTKAPLIGVEYLVEHPPEEEHYEPSYICVLCTKKGHPRTIVNHMTCFWHRYNYLSRHFNTACTLLGSYRNQTHREGMVIILNRLAQRIEDTYGRLKPMHIDREVFEENKEPILKWMYQSRHFSENDGNTFEEVVDKDLIESMNRSADRNNIKTSKDPSPPKVAAPKPAFNDFNRSAGRRGRQRSPALSDVSDDSRREQARGDRYKVDHRFEPYPDRKREGSPSVPQHRFNYKKKDPLADPKKAPNYHYKIKLAQEKMETIEGAARHMLAYHEKNPEKHPLYPVEWKKFWNRRYKEIQAEGKDPSKHDFKPEWIVYWTSRMKVLFKEEMRTHEVEIYRKYCLSPPPEADKVLNDDKKSEPRRRSPERRRSPGRRSPEPRREARWSPARTRSPGPRRRSPEGRRRPPPPRRRSRSPHYNDKWRPINRSQERLVSPSHHRTDSRSPHRDRRTNIVLDSVRVRSRSPLSRRDPPARNPEPGPARNPEPGPAPSMQTVLVSDDELKPDDGLSPWNSDDSLGSLPEARSPAPSLASSARSRRQTYPRPQDPRELGSAENVVATLRLLVALEDYLGSLGPKIVDLLTEALRMEKEEANSSEELLVRESAVVLIETAKEKLKGAMQAGLVPHNATAAVRSAVVRAAATLHEADNRAKKKQAQPNKKAAVAVAGVGAVDRAQVAQQMAAALVAQGKSDVSPEELEQLVDAVVGMAEAKKREANAKAKLEARASAARSSRPAAASALQMLQSAYDENEKRAEKDAPDVPDAMDGLSDSDLETLLKNFSELSAEEQHSLIAYLKKMEAREPHRVEKLRQYVSAAATASPPADTPAPEPVQPKTVTIESDDDDYTVEDVVKSATQKVKEDQIRQEMEVVTKSLLETNAPTDTTASSTSSIADITKNISSATDLFALVQASLKSTTAPKTTSDVLTTNSQPRSFGDPPGEQAKPLNLLLQQTLRNLQASSNAHNQNDNSQNQPLNPEPAFGTNMNYDNQGEDMYGSQGQGFNNLQGGYGDQNQGFGNQQVYGNDNFGNQLGGIENDQGNYSHQQGQGNYDNYGNQQDNFGNQPGNFGNQGYANHGQDFGYGNQQGFNQPVLSFGNRQGNQNFGGNRNMNRGGFNPGPGNNFPNNKNNQQFGNKGNQQYGNNQNNQSRGGRGRGNFRGGRGRGRGW